MQHRILVALPARRACSGVHTCPHDDVVRPSQGPVVRAAEELQQKAMMFVTGALTVNLIGLGDELGLYKALKANGGPMTPLELAKGTNTHERWIREWLYQQVRCCLAQP